VTVTEVVELPALTIAVLGRPISSGWSVSKVRGVSTVVGAFTVISSVIVASSGVPPGGGATGSGLDGVPIIGTVPLSLTFDNVIFDGAPIIGTVPVS